MKNETPNLNNAANSDLGAVGGSVSLNEFTKNVFKSVYNFLDKIQDKFPADFLRVEISTRGGGKSFYITFDDKEDSNFDYSIRISDHELNDWNELSYNNIGNFITNDGNYDLSCSLILQKLIKVRVGYFQ